MTLKDRYDAITHEITEVCKACGRPREAVRVIGVSKTVDLDAVEEAVATGLHDFAENRPAELVRKHDAFPHERWHFIGNIQSRQLKDIVGRACLIHSLYRQEHAEKINRLAAERNIVQDVLIEVNDGEENKQGLPGEDLVDMLLFCHTLEHVRPLGLMTMAPQGSCDLADATFERLAALRTSAQIALVEHGINDINLHELSMGMSDDYLEAIPRGATMVRIGRALFSENYTQRSI